jgi:uncharacterized protein YkwD
VRTRFTALCCFGGVALLALLAPGAAAARQEAAGRASATPQAIVLKINAVRKSHGLRALRVAGGLARAARTHASSMAAGGYFSHGSVGSRVRHYYSGSTIGETILWRSPDITAEQAVQMWMNSSGHRRLLLYRGFREIGVGIVRRVAGGAFGGRMVAIVVADFGAR